MEHSHHPVELRTIIRRAYDRTDRLLRSRAPTLAGYTAEWTRSLCGDAAPDRYFTHFDAFPMLLLPWWFEEQIAGEPDQSFQSDLVYSTVNGYYFVRMVDDLMDGERPPPSAVLPALIVFHTEFVRPYRDYFPTDDDFWASLSAWSLASAEMAARDSAHGVATRTEFIETSARKISGAQIPLTAVAHRYGRVDLLGPWRRFVEVFGRWHQMRNDILGWQEDLQHGRRTYFLSRAPAGDLGGVAEWVINDGLTWGFAELEAWMDDSLRAATDVGSPPLADYLFARRDADAAHRDQLTRSLEPLRRLSSALR